MKPETISDEFWRSLGPRLRWEVVALEQELGILMPCGTRYTGGARSDSDWNLYTRAEFDHFGTLQASGWKPKGKPPNPYEQMEAATLLTKEIQGREATILLCYCDEMLEAMRDATEIIRTSETPLEAWQRKTLTQKIVDGRLNNRIKMEGPTSYRYVTIAITSQRLRYPSSAFPGVERPPRDPHLRKANEYSRMREERIAEMRKAMESELKSSSEKWGRKKAKAGDTYREMVSRAMAATEKYSYIDVKPAEHEQF